MNRSRMTRIAVSLTALAALGLGATACEGTDDNVSKVTASTEGKTKGDAPKKKEAGVADQFKAYVEKNGTANEKTAVGHVTKLIGADNNNDILDSAEIHTNYAGDLMSPDAASGKLLASSFAEFQASRNKGSKNGLVTVYNAKGEILSNGKF